MQARFQVGNFLKSDFASDFFSVLNSFFRSIFLFIPSTVMQPNTATETSYV